MVKHAQQEVDYRLSKWLIWNAGKEQLLTPDEVENVFRELLSFYDPPTRCVESAQSMFNRASSTLPFKLRQFAVCVGRTMVRKPGTALTASGLAANEALPAIRARTHRSMIMLFSR